MSTGAISLLSSGPAPDIYGARLVSQVLTPAPATTADSSPEIDRALARMDAWLETMRCPGGYGGPVSHWWQQCLTYTGAGLDWRYEGIIAGYLHLWRRTGGQHWLDKARRAGDDLVEGQFDNGHFPASAFELNPATAGTPHEAACDHGLLLLAQALRDAGAADWSRYADAAVWNIRSFYLGQLWDEAAQAFRDSPNTVSFVPNKAATACDALFLLADLTEDDSWVERYALPTLRRLRQHQIAGGPLDGGIAQNSFGSHVVAKYFPIYMARCIPALLSAYRWTREEFYLDSARRAMMFITRWHGEGGLPPTVVYANGRLATQPTWVAALGDVLRAADALHPYGVAVDLDSTRARLLAGQDASGGIQTAQGFGGQGLGGAGDLPDFRDLLHVAGWCDKAFRYMAAHAGPSLPLLPSERFEADCSFRGHTYQFVETPEQIEAIRSRRVCYRWRKGAHAPDVAEAEFWLR